MPPFPILDANYPFAPQCPKDTIEDKLFFINFNFQLQFTYNIIVVPGVHNIVIRH